MTSPALFRAELNGRTAIDLEIRRAEIGLVRDNAKDFTATVWVEATQPGMTLDDRGAPGWDAPVALEVSLGSLGAATHSGGFAPKRGPVGAERSNTDGFFYYWDHTDFDTLAWSLQAPGQGRFEIDLNCSSTEGHSVTCRAAIPDIYMVLADPTPEDHARLPLLFGRPAEEIGVKVGDDKLVARWPEQAP